MEHIDQNELTDFAIEAIKNRTVAAFAAQVCAGIPVPVIPYICHYAAAYTMARAAFSTGTASKPKGEKENEDRTID